MYMGGGPVLNMFSLYWLLQFENIHVPLSCTCMDSHEQYTVPFRITKVLTINTAQCNNHSHSCQSWTSAWRVVVGRGGWWEIRPSALKLVNEWFHIQLWILICRHVQLFLPFLHDWGIHSLKLCCVWKTVIRVVLEYRKRGKISTNIVQWYSFWTEDHCHHVITTNIQLLQVSDYTNSMLDMVKRHQRWTNTFCIKKYYLRLEQTYIHY